MKKAIAILLVLVMCLSLCACGKSEAAKNVEDLIAGIGEVSLESKEAIEKAQDAYDALTEKEKSSVENFSELGKAITEYERELAEYERELAEYKEQSYQADVGAFIQRMHTITDLCDVQIEFYNNTSNAIYSSNKHGKDLDFSECLELMLDAAKYQNLENWRKSWESLGDYFGYWKLRLFQLASIVCPDNYKYDWDKCIISYDRIDYSQDADTIFSRANAYSEAMSELIQYEQDDAITLKMVTDIEKNYGDIHSDEITALKQWYLAVSEGINYTLNSTGSLSTIVSGWDAKKATILQTEKMFNLA